jgi:hypothetical protein
MVGLFAIYLTTDRFVPVIASMLLFLFLVVAVLDVLLIIRPWLMAFVDANFFLGREHWYPPSLAATADWILAWSFWILWAFTFLFFGLSMWITRDEIGKVAAIGGPFLVIWGGLQLILQFFSHGVEGSIFQLFWILSSLPVYFLSLAYFVLAFQR